MEELLEIAGKAEDLAEITICHFLCGLVSICVPGCANTTCCLSDSQKAGEGNDRT